MADPIGKACRLCGEWKSLDDYHKKSNAKDGHQPRCKDCAKRVAKEWYEANKDRAAASQRARRAPGTPGHQAQSAYMREYYRQNRDRWRTPEMREHYRRRAAMFAKRVKDGDPEAVKQKRAADRRYYERHRDRIKEQVAAYAEAKRDDPLFRLDRQERVRRRRARKKAAGVWTVTRRDLERLIARHNGLCAYCGAAEWEHIDHVVPLARNGRHAIGNLLPACSACNLSKGALLLAEWRHRQRLAA